MTSRSLSLLCLAALAATGACSDDDPTKMLVTESTGSRFPDVIAAHATFDETSGTWSFEVTISSPYDSPERYADGWRILGPDAEEYGVHTLTHDHAAEQPFTRRQSGVAIPADVTTVVVEGRDLANGYGGATLTVSLEP